jgi:hypothetical protein
MRCSKCDSDNREGRKFCTTCGTALVTSCPKCGAPIQLGESFCGECGTALGETAPAAAVDTALITASAGGERRHLTVSFCDLIGSTEIGARLDPEESREIVADYHRAAAQAIERYGGHVAQYLGDGVMAYFGWPEAHDNDAERAAAAGYLGYAYAASGDRTRAMAVLQELRQQSSRGFVSPFWPAIIYLGLGDRQRSLEGLEKPYEVHDPWVMQLKMDRVFDALRSDPRFIELLRELRLDK